MTGIILISGAVLLASVYPLMAVYGARLSGYRVHTRGPRRIAVQATVVPPIPSHPAVAGGQRAAITAPRIVPGEVVE